MSEAAPVEACPEAAEILRVAGWKPHDEWGVYTRDTLVMGFTPDGLHFPVKNWGRDIHGPDYPDDPVGAALWLVAKFPRPANPLSSEATLDAPLALPPEEEESLRDDAGKLDADLREDAGGAEGVGRGGERDIHDHAGPEGDEEFPASDVVEPLVVEDDAPVHEEPPEGDWRVVEGSAGADPLDADFTVEDLGSETDELDDLTSDLPALEGADVLEVPDEPPFDGPVTYQGSDLDSLIREKLGRVSQIARELKAKLQEGWTLEEFAYLQNQIIRMDRSEAPDDPEARASFNFISERSRAMGAVNLIRDGKEDELTEIGARRAYAEAQAFDPEAGWPENQ